MDPTTGAHDSSQTIQADNEKIQSDDEEKAQPIDPNMEDEIKEMMNEFEIYLTKKMEKKRREKKAPKAKASQITGRIQYST